MNGAQCSFVQQEDDDTDPLDAFMADVNKEVKYLNEYVRLRQFYLGQFEFPIISNSEPFSLDLPFSHLLSAISNSCYFKLFFDSPESLK